MAEHDKLLPRPFPEYSLPRAEEQLSLFVIL